jgi:DNA-binding response OmpR family regulator
MPRILLVEDEPAYARAIRRFLSRRGHDVDWCDCASEALMRITPDAYDFLILDLQLPDFDGIALYSVLRERGMVLPTLLLSGRASPEERVKALEVGMDDVLAKDVREDEIDARIRARLAAPRSRFRAPAVPAVLEVESRLLRIGARAIPLPPKSFALLARMQAVHGGEQSATRGELCLAAWPEGSGSDARLSVELSRLRKLLGTDAWRLCCLPGSRYRFVFGAVSEVPARGDAEHEL